MMYALCNYRITNINVGSNLLGDETSLSARKLVGEGYMMTKRPSGVRSVQLVSLDRFSLNQKGRGNNFRE